jgi:hypothetical protein
MRDRCRHQVPWVRYSPGVIRYARAVAPLRRGCPTGLDSKARTVSCCWPASVPIIPSDWRRGGLPQPREAGAMMVPSSRTSVTSRWCFYWHGYRQLFSLVRLPPKLAIPDPSAAGCDSSADISTRQRPTGPGCGVAP